MNYEELFERLDIQFISIGSGKLVGRDHASNAIEKFYQAGLDLLGYDAFTVFPDGKRQPHTEFCASFDKNSRNAKEAVESMHDDPLEVTHYEFIVRQRT